MARDSDVTRRLQVVREAPAPQRTPAANAAARYRARKRGEPVAKRKPGPKPKKITELRQEIRELEGRIQELNGLLNIARGRSARQTGALSIHHAAGELLDILQRRDPARDSPETRVRLGDLIAAIETRHEYWPD
jgi:hypothetical protein